jgi:hypothetical protein
MSNSLLMAVASFLAYWLLPTPVVSQTSVCNESAVRDLVGLKATDLDLEKARMRAGAGRVRTFVQGRAYTMESISDRLSIFVDGKGTVVAVSCG